ncbi:MAG: leucyl/phenylalanyl-tRNA--protein transferase [Rubellimicrobium sp.]|nr:leucyl/phenylalanyl-tRNA--protein transferase [Rubellimicrobium sp.]
MLSADILLAGYAQGIFPMAEGRRSDEVFWVSPERRGIFPLGGFHISHSLRRRLKSGRHSATADSAFAEVVAACADRPETWINDDLTRVYDDLHRMGHAHSIEIRTGETLIGGVFGIAIGAAFFGESMFSRATDGSKMALAVLHARLVAGGFRLFDTQFLTPHLASLGAVEIPRGDYLLRLADAIRRPAAFYSAGASSGAGVRVNAGVALSGS